MHYGFLGSYNPAVGLSPFERFRLGGSGLTGFNFFLGYDLIGLRGYNDASVKNDPNESAGVVYNKHVMELRYPITLNPAASIFVLTFAEAGNNWSQYSRFNPFTQYKSVGVGARIFMPAFGLLGIDYGYGLDEVPGLPDASRNRFTFSIGQQLR
jgi:outer membrane protein insertion porin family